MTQTIRVSLPGYNALTDTNIDHYALYADSDNVLIKEQSRGTVSAGYFDFGTVTHNLGYVPFFLVYSPLASGRYRINNSFDPVGSGWAAYAGTSELIIRNREGTAGTVSQYYIFYDDMS